MKRVWMPLVGIAVGAVVAGAGFLVWMVLTDWAGWVADHSVATDAIVTGGSAVVVLLAAFIAFWGARYQGKSALEAAQKQIDHSIKKGYDASIENKIKIASTFIMEIDTIIMKIISFKNKKRLYNHKDLDDAIIPHRIYDAMILEIVLIGPQSASSVFLFYSYLIKMNEHNKISMDNLHTLENPMKFYTGKTYQGLDQDELQNALQYALQNALQDALQSLEILQLSADDLRDELSQLIKKWGGTPPERFLQNSQAPDPDPATT